MDGKACFRASLLAQTFLSPMSLKTHLQVLEESAETYSTRPVFQLPVLAPGGAEVTEWRAVPYSQFKSDVDRYARYWARTFAADGLPRRSVVGVW